MKEIKENPRAVYESSAANDPEAWSELSSYVDALEKDPIGRTRGLVSACRKSGQRRDDLKNIIQQGNEKGLWTLNLLQLLRDVETRWSSTYLMTTRILYLYEVMFLV